MKVNIKDRVYEVHFETTMKESERPDKKGEFYKYLTTIRCYIKEVFDDHTFTPIVDATVVQHYNDAPNNVFARKLAFTIAVNFAMPRIEDGEVVVEDGEIVEDSIFSKEERTIFWNEYKKNSRYERKNLRSKNRELQYTITRYKQTEKELKEEIEKLKQEVGLASADL